MPRPTHQPNDQPDSRPRLNPALAQLWRDPTTLQIGLDPARAVVAGELNPVLRDVLARLDGRHTRSELLHAAVAAGADPLIVHRLLAELSQAGVLTHAPPPGAPPFAGPAEIDRLAPELASLSLLPGRSPTHRLGQRRAASVQVLGASRISVPLAATVAAAGVGRVVVLDSGTVLPADCSPGGMLVADENRPRRAAADEAVSRAAPAVDCSLGTGPDLVVLCAPWPDPAICAPLVAQGIAHLIATVREGTAVIGPLVRPGESSCLQCADLHRTDRDPAWPVLLAQLVSRGRPGVDPVDAALALFVAAVGSMQVLAHLDRGADRAGSNPALVDRAGPGATDEASLELRPPDWRLRRRSWPPHPDCGCVSPSAGSGWAERAG